MVRATMQRRYAGWVLGLIGLAGACGGRQVHDDPSGSAGGNMSSAGKSNGKPGTPATPGTAGTAATGATAGAPATAGTAATAGAPATLGGSGSIEGGAGGQQSAGSGGVAAAGAAGGPSTHQSCNPAAPQCPAGHECRINLIGSYWCDRCGGPNEPCCSNNPAGPGTTCRDGGCCVGHVCTANGEACGERKLGQCTAGKCTHCGELGQSCCGNVESAACLGSNLVCDLNTPANGGGAGSGGASGQLVSECQACGEPGQPCCDNGACADGGCCNPKPGSGFGLRYCVAQGNQCVDGASCKAQSCGACGGKGQPCCSAPNSENAFCSAPLLLCTSIDGKPAVCLEPL